MSISVVPQYEYLIAPYDFTTCRTLLRLIVRPKSFEKLMSPVLDKIYWTVFSRILYYLGRKEVGEEATTFFYMNLFGISNGQHNTNINE